jgi:uncharacterized membrane-anchored protein YhcB (DUF1043 family)
MNKIRLIMGLVVAVISFSYLFAYAIPNMQRAQENVRIAQEEYDQSQAELEQAYNDLNASVDEILEENE